MTDNREQFIKEIGERIRAFRLEQKMTLLDLAVKSEMEENALQKIEKKQNQSNYKNIT